MAFRFLSAVVFCAFLTSCAYQGVIVDKSGRDLPFSESVGVGGSFAFMLKDNTGAVHRQLVTPDVFARYEVGEYFNDLQPTSARSQPHGVSDGKTMLSASNHTPAKARQVASRHKIPRTDKVASKAKAGKSVRKVAEAKRSPAVAQKIAPVVQSSAIVKTTPSVTSAPVVKIAPVLKSASVVKMAPVVKAEPVKLAQAAPRDDAEIVYISVVRCR